MFYIQSLHARVEQSEDDETPYLINKVFLSREGIVDKSEVNARLGYFAVAVRSFPKCLQYMLCVCINIVLNVPVGSCYRS